MSPRILLGGALLAVLAGCRAAPTALDAVVEEGTAINRDVVVSADVLTTVLALLDDPFVHELVESVDDPSMAKSVRSVFLDMSAAATEGRTPALYGALMLAHRELTGRTQAGDNDEDHAVLRAALGLVLEQAQALLDESRSAVPASDERPLQAH